ncbi:MAG: hypothetical protein AB2A00_10840 [Myxococcota bacterium]
MAVVAVITVAVLTQMNAGQRHLVAASRERAESQARALAEMGLERMSLYATQYMQQVPAVPDLDGLLDPSLGASLDGDEFIPPASFASGSTVVHVPKNATGTPLRAALHRYRMVKMNGGAYLVRVDDNSDDGLTGLATATGNNTVAEGLGSSVLFRDRDRSVFLTAIGIYPVPPGTSDADAYEKASARITLKRFLSPQPAPGLFAGGSVNVKDDVAVCGAGGITSDTVNYVGSDGPSDVCVCGAQNLESGPTTSACTDPSNDSDLASACDTPANCATSSSDVGSAQTAPSVTVPGMPAAGWRSLSAIGVSGVLNLGTNNVCELYFQDVDTAAPGNGDDIFLWDHTDTANGCNNATPDPAPPPCSWPSTATTAGTADCSNGGSRCWKLIARINNVAGESLGGATEHTVNDGGEFFAANASQPIPNVADPSMRWPGMCGGAGTCTNCNGTSNTTWGISGSEWTMKNAPRCASQYPSPTIHFFDNPPGQAVMADASFGDPSVCSSGGSPVVTAYLVRNDLSLKEDSAYCCPTCDCATAIPYGSACNPTVAGRSSGTAVRAGGHCYFREDLRVIGAISCSSLNIRDGTGGGCILSDTVVAHGEAPTPLPGGWNLCSDPLADLPTSCDSPGVCVKQNTTIVGTVYSAADLCIRENSNVMGSLVAAEDVGIKEDSEVFGQVVAGGDISIRNDVLINNDGNGSFGTATRTVAWLEAAY